MFKTVAGKLFINFIHICMIFNSVTISFKFGRPAVTCKDILWRDLSCAMEPLETLVKSTDTSAKRI